MDGWLILDKPLGISSALAVSKVKRLLKPKKIGHAGTLDPLASGILPLALGEATKTVAYMMDARKAYAFTVKWGEERSTDDCEGEVTATSDKRPSKDDILSILENFRGDIAQTPPVYSAIKVDGERAYDLARSGQTVTLKSRKVTIYSIELTEYNDNSATFICHCGKGTYIRSIARDMGKKLGCFGHVTMLRRLKVGNFEENHAISLEVLEEMVHKGGLSLRPVESALDDIPALDIDSSQAVLLKRGQAISVEQVIHDTLLARYNGKAIAICKASQGQVKPVRVFNIE